MVLNYNGVDFLWNCLFSLKTQTYENFEVLLVDNASKDGSVPFAKSNYPDVRVLECHENFGYALGNNLGVKATQHADYVVFLNNDTVVPPDWLKKLVEFYQEHHDQAAAVMSLVKDKGMPEEYFEKNGTLNLLGHLIRRSFGDLTTVFYPTGCSFLYEPKRFPGPPFDPDYFLYREDVLFGWRCRLKGYQVFQAPDSKVFHVGSATTRRVASLRITFFQERNRYLNMLTCYGFWTLARLLPWFILDMAACVLYALITARRSVLGTLAAYLWLPLHIPAILKKRHPIQKERKVSDARILPLLSGKLFEGDSRLVEFLNDVSLLYCQITGLKVLELELEKKGKPG